MRNSPNSRQTPATNGFVVVDHHELTSAEHQFAEQFEELVIGQPAVVKVAQLAYNLARNPLRNRKRPVGIFLFAGKSRRGKSHSARALAQLFHGSEDALTRLQASDYQLGHQFLDIKGAAPTYVGYRDPKDPKYKLQAEEIDPYSVLSTHNLRRVRLNSSSRIDIVVVEEWEKASQDFYKLFMGIFDNGFLRLGNGELVDFSNTIFILTSNIGMDDLERREKKGRIGFVQAERPSGSGERDVEKAVREALEATYKPEFRNRLDAVVVFSEFTQEAIDRIVDAEIGRLQTRINEQMPPGKDFLLLVTDEAKKRMLHLCDNNVAQLRNTIEREITVPLGRLLGSGQLSGGDMVRIDCKETRFLFAVAEGAYGVSQSESYLKAYGKTGEDSRRALGMQREILKAAASAKLDGIQEWIVTLPAGDEEELMSSASELMHEMREVIEVQAPVVTFVREAPFRFVATVRASKKQAELLRRFNPHISVRCSSLPEPSSK